MLETVREDGHIGAPDDEESEMRCLISDRSEEQLESRYKRSALLLGCLGLGLFLFGSVFIVVVVAGLASMAASVAIETSVATMVFLLLPYAW